MRTGRAVALVMGAAFVASVLTGRSALFVRPWFSPVLLATGAAVVVLAVSRGVTVSRVSALLLLLPVLAGALLRPGTVGKVSPGSFDTSSLASRLGERPNPLLGGSGGAVTLLDILLAADRVGGVALAGRRVSVEAIVAAPDRISRSVMVCCAADARAIGLRVVGTALPPPGVWVRVDGVLTTDRDELVLRADRVGRIAVPQQPFL